MTAYLTTRNPFTLTTESNRALASTALQSVPADSERIDKATRSELAGESSHRKWQDFSGVTTIDPALSTPTPTPTPKEASEVKEPLPLVFQRTQTHSCATGGHRPTPREFSRSGRRFRSEPERPTISRTLGAGSSDRRSAIKSGTRATILSSIRNCSRPASGEAKMIGASMSGDQVQARMRFRASAVAGLTAHNKNLSICAISFQNTSWNQAGIVQQAK